MSIATPPVDEAAISLADIGKRLAFTKKLQNTTNKIHAARCIDDILTEVSVDICDLFEAERITLYLQSEDGQAIVAKVKTGLNQLKSSNWPSTPAALPVTLRSIKPC